MKLSSLLIALLVMITLSSCSKEAMENNEAVSTEEITVTPKSVEDIILTEELVVAINDFRISENLPSLIIDNGTAEALAMKHSTYMSHKNEASHDHFLSRAEALKNTGAISVKENVAFGYSNAQAIVNAWVNSDSHKEALKGEFNYIGIGFANSHNDTKYCTLLLYKK